MQSGNGARRARGAGDDQRFPLRRSANFAIDGDCCDEESIG